LSSVCLFFTKAIQCVLCPNRSRCPISSRSDQELKAKGKAKKNTFKRKDIDKLIVVVDEDYSGAIELSEFIVVLDFMRRAHSDPSVR
jgi:hypothetical protein